MGAVSDREHLAWLAWLDRQLHEPNFKSSTARLEHYLMRNAAEVRQGVIHKGVSLQDMRIKYQKRKVTIRIDPTTGKPVKDVPRPWTKKEIVRAQQIQKMREMGLNPEDYLKD
jgi:hypothetical protein